MSLNKRNYAMEHVVRGLRGIVRFIHGSRRRWRSRVVPQMPIPPSPPPPPPRSPHVEHHARKRRRPRGTKRRSSTCLICMESLELHASARVVCDTRRCPAVYHRNCIIKWQRCAAAQQPYAERSNLRRKCLLCTVGNLRGVYQARRVDVTEARRGAAPRESRRSSQVGSARRRR